MRLGQKKYLLAMISIIAILIIAGSFIPHFYSINNLLNVMRQSSVVGICAIGTTLVVIILGIDLSIGGVLSFTAMICGQLMLSNVGILISALIALVVGIIFGVFNGILIAKIDVPPFIATLAVGKVASGLALVISQG
ncbi:MAG TPA: hypothetical protein VJY12_01535, partial [Dysgonamonadaceae bacterium]|nr:hypothetical protein [Dysgonamonadaceae bacterium]